MAVNLRLSSSPNGTRNQPVNSMDLVADFGAVGDGQRATVTATISSGSPNLEVGTAIFASGDAGKAIAIWVSGTQRVLTTILTFTDSTHVVLAANLTGSTISAASVDVLWGTNNTNAFTGVSGSWRAWAQTQTNPALPPVLEIPDGNYVATFSAAAGASLNYGVLNNAKIRGLSGTAANCKLMQLNPSEMRFGHNPAIVSNKGLANAGGNSARLQTALAGATTVTLVNPSGTDDGAATYGSRIVTGRVCLLAAFDTQGLNDGDFGYPPNGFFYEWNVITGYNSGTGEVTLQNPLTQGYKSTYPQWCPNDTSFASGHTSGSDQGGPFTIWVAPDGYNNTITLENFTVDCPHNQSAVLVRHVVLNNLVMSGPAIYPTQNDTFTATNCVYPNQLEIDKMVNLVTWNNCTLNRIQQQSASPNRCIVNGGTIGTLGTAKYTEANGVAFTGVAKVEVGVSTHGRTDRVVLTNCTGIATIQRGGATTDDLGGSSGPTAQTDASDFFVFVAGVIKFLKTENDSAGGFGQQNITRCFVPGTWVTFDDKYIDKVMDVYEDGTYCYVQFANTTNWPFTPVGRIKVHPCPDFTMTNCTGTAPELEDWNQATARIPLYSYSKRTRVAGASAATAETTGILLIGKLVSESINVTTPYVGVGALNWKDSVFSNRNYMKLSDFTTASDYGNTVNMKISGERVIRAATTATGAQSLDTLEDMTTPGQVNFYGTANSQAVFSSNVTGETPTLTVEYIMDQGIPAP